MKRNVCFLFEEITGTDLIIQFLISANLIEQKTKMKSATENPSMLIHSSFISSTLFSLVDDIELKDNRIRALRHLAMKIAAKLNWDLVIIEKR